MHDKEKEKPQPGHASPKMCSLIRLCGWYERKRRFWKQHNVYCSLELWGGSCRASALWFLKAGVPTIPSTLPPVNKTPNGSMLSLLKTIKEMSSLTVWSKFKSWSIPLAILLYSCFSPTFVRLFGQFRCISVTFKLIFTILSYITWLSFSHTWAVIKMFLVILKSFCSLFKDVKFG